MSWGLVLEDRSLKSFVKGQRGSDQSALAQLPVALPPPCDLGEGSVITWRCIFAVCPMGTIVLSIWEGKQSSGIGSLKLLLAAAGQGLLSVDLHRVKMVLEN